MTLESIELLSGREDAPVRASLIVLHGLGADGGDFVPVCRRLGLESVGPVRCVLPHAPERPVTRNGGYLMRAWFDLYAPGADQENMDDVRASQVLIDGLIDREITRGIPASRIALMGFSQGCAMALYAGLRHPQRLAGIVALSGYLPRAGVLAAEASLANRDLPVFMAHGRHDSVVLPERADSARRALEALGQPLEWRDYPIDHEVSIPEIADIGRWLQRVLA
ncbi:alpha/beta hydrolase [Methyloversatilis thermotolerans]|uniref:alpha/beta hydrolase n=1 Tax=Methyloversatilis thermotolerans TaxID=1346290 RepID=UPI00037BA0F4|nr:hypothetical protein [Methyloversatilis thermotolerans]